MAGEVQHSRVQIKRGLESTRTSIIPDVAELIYTTDEKKLFVGDGTTSGGIILAGSDFSTLVGTSGADALHKHSKLSNPSSDAEVVTVDSSSDVGIGTTLPDGKLHIFRDDTSIVPSVDADELIIEGTGNTGISFLGSTSSIQSILFGDTDDNNVGVLKYTHGDSITDDSLTVTVNATETLYILDNRVGIGLVPTTESLELDGGLLLGNSSGTANGTLRYSGTDLEGRVGDSWTSLTAGGGTSGGLSQTFRGLHLRTHPDYDVAEYTVSLVHADEIIFDDGVRVTSGLDNLEADITISGAGGLDAGSEASDTWYKIFVIRKSSDETLDLLLHREKNYLLDQEYITGRDSSVKLREGATTGVKLAQGFQVSVSGECPFIEARIETDGSPTGTIWFTLEADASGNPSGTPLATSDKIDITNLSGNNTAWQRYIFRSPTMLSTSTQYWLVLQGDYTPSTTNAALWSRDSTSSSYPNGTLSIFNGTTWSADSDDDFLFKLFITQNETSITMPSGYDQKCLIGYVYNNGNGHFDGMVAHNNRVKPLVEQSLGLFSNPNSILLLTDISTLVPPVPLRIGLFGGLVSLENQFLVISGVPDGHAGIAGPGNANPSQYGRVIRLSEGSYAQDIEFMGYIHTEFQALYWGPGSGTGKAWVADWEW